MSEAGQAKAKRQLVPFLWAVVDLDGTPHMSESCVCQDPEPLRDDARAMNDDLPPEETRRYKVVPLYRRYAHE